ncbi:Cof-type HAD-IIB family hydrolase [Clostridium sp. C2-6-12]|uniref:Cof-type HAD-IIB family hydrolase n=1 Tax=Clostridium sp. C2-6-12 TaxID=2698832 RepID=UPI001367A965|nr:Cof-type HAD-IIB family hydrolase [Clostridium sp. C2-6-12]
MGKKAVFFDIDGTLYNPKIGVPESTVKGICELKNKGNLAFISTGRTRAIISEDLVDLGFDGVLAACGTYVEYKGKIIYNVDLKKEIIDKAVDILRRYKVFCILEGRNYLYMDDNVSSDYSEYSVNKFKSMFGEKIRPITGEEHYVNKITCKMDEHSNFKEAYKELNKEFDPIYHNSGLVELVPKGFSKAKGIEEIIKYLGIDINDTYAFGDSANDIDMLKYVKYGIAMGNSNSEILEMVEYKTDNIENNGIYNGLKKFKLI